MGNALFSLIVFLLPTQLGRHFWLPFSYVYGLPVDYLSVVVYLTDLFVAAYLILNLSLLIRLLKKNLHQPFFWLVLVLIIANIVFSVSPPVTLIAWLRFLLLFSFAAVIVSRRLSLSHLIPPLSLSLGLTLIIGFAQLINAASLGGIFYYLGERTFDLSTPSLAKSALCVSSRCITFLRPYASFSHPSSLSGFLALSLPLLVFAARNKSTPRPLRIWYTSLVASSVILILFASLKLFLLLLLSLFLAAVFIRLHRPRLCLSFLLLLNLLVIPAGRLLFLNPSILHSLPSTITERLALNLHAVNKLIARPLTGVGLNAFIPSLADGFNPFFVSVHRLLLQPAHHFFLLLATQLGLPLFAVVIHRLYRLIRSSTLHPPYYYLLVVFLVTSALDHYWLTLPQNQYLLIVLIAVGYNSSHDRH